MNEPDPALIQAAYRLITGPPLSFEHTPDHPGDQILTDARAQGHTNAEIMAATHAAARLAHLPIEGCACIGCAMRLD